MGQKKKALQTPQEQTKTIFANDKQTVKCTVTAHPNVLLKRLEN